MIDAATGRGVPLVELQTVNSLKLVTDNAGRVAFHEPGLMGREVYFSVHSHGYEAERTPSASRASALRLGQDTSAKSNSPAETSPSVCAG